MEVRTFAFLQIVVFVALGIQLFAAVTDAADADDEFFTVDYCGMNCTLQQDGSWTPCTQKNAECKCYHESGSSVGLCLSTAYTDFNQFGDPNNSDLDAATPRHPDASSR
uniref:Evasin P1229 n=1 Tax=Ixodes ricinus TaxID=34613 RepID=E1229_IXORI|nr:RecName: Full=Evasin P1229; Flags: Precursor [Ixodes ricinus]